MQKLKNINEEIIFKKMSNWINYSFKSMLFRLTIEIIITIVTIKLVSILKFDEKQLQKMDYWVYIIYIFCYTMLSEIIIYTNHKLDQYFPIPHKIIKRMLIQAIINIFTLITILFIGQLFLSWHYKNTELHIPLLPSIGLGIGLFIVAILTRSIIIIKMQEQWRDAQQQITKIKQEKLIMKYNSLQDQLNPHFLFNNISILKSLIYYDKKKAIEFTENFADVYRYVLKNTEKKTVKLKDELEFINSFVKLHKTRIGKGLITNINIKTEDLAMEIAPLTIQLLIENAIKHNIANEDNNLIINIISKNKTLEINNNIQLKKSSYSTHKGINNLIKRYQFLTDKTITINKNNNKFAVKVPLL